MTNEEKIIVEIERLKVEEYGNGTMGDDVAICALESIEDFINSLSEEPISEDLEESAEHSKEEWSEEDNIMLSLVIRDYEGAFTISEYDYDNVISWLKSLSPYSQWKPSEEQIEILDMVLTNESMDANIARILRELREQLKKLK